MKLERITRTPAGRPRPTPLLFVHGSYCGAWVWDRHFLPYFARHGYDAHALSLRGHGESEGRETLPFHGLRDFVADVELVAGMLPRPPVLIGHSLGGLVVQHLFRRGPIPAAVLMAPVPPHGFFASAVGMALTKPWLYAGMAWAGVAGPSAVPTRAVRKALFSDATPDDEVLDCFRRFQPESARVVVDLMGFDLPPSRPETTNPVLVLGAENDGFVSPAALAATGRAYRTTPEVFPGLAHAMMLDHGWKVVARRILEWLAETVDGADAPSREG